MPVTVRDLSITGRELVDLGLRGARIGEVQRKLLHDVLSQPKLNTNEWLTAAAAREA